MQNLKFLNKKEIKNILNLIKNQWGCDIKLDYVFVTSEKNKLYIINKEVSEIELEKIRINSFGLYFGTIHANNLRLSIEGSQIIGPKAKKNVIELNENEFKEWMKGTDIDKEANYNGFVILKHNNDFLGCGKATDKKILNYVPKGRRVSVYS